MAYVIKTVEYHQNAIAECRAANIRRLDLNVEDCALSFWADQNMIQFHEQAIKALQLGSESGIDGPAGYGLRLMQGERTVNARTVNGQYGDVWLLSDEEAQRFGRKFVPVGEKSRVQKSLGLSEAEVLVPVSRKMASHCAGIGCPVSFSLVEQG